MRIAGRSLQQVGRELLPRSVFDALRECWSWFDPAVIPVEDRFVQGGAVPHSRGYIAYRAKQISAVLSDPVLMKTFAAGNPLPDGYGVGLDERCIEYPWFLTHLDPAAEHILDAGSTLNHEFILADQALSSKKLHILTLAPEPVCFWQRGISYLFHDLRAIPIADHYYDAIACLSTLEHVGFDNSAYGAAATAADERAFVDVMKEFRRLLKPGGQAYLTVPFGAHEKHGWFQQFDGRLLRCAIEAMTPRESHCWFYKYSAAGWQICSEADAQDSKYVSWLRPDTLPSPIPVESDKAAAARALACVRLTV